MGCINYICKYLGIMVDVVELVGFDDQFVLQSQLIVVCFNNFDK